MQFAFLSLAVQYKKPRSSGVFCIGHTQPAVFNTWSHIGIQNKV